MWMSALLIFAEWIINPIRLSYEQIQLFPGCKLKTCSAIGRFPIHNEG